MLRIKRILPLLIALFALGPRAWAVAAKTAAMESGGAVSVGNPLSGSGIQNGLSGPVLSAPGLLPALGAPLGSPAVTESKPAASPLPIQAPEQIVTNVQAADVLKLPQSVLKSPVPAPASPGEVPAGPGRSQAVPDDSGVVLHQAPGSSEESRGPPAEEPALIKRARRYIRDIMGSRAPTEAETEALLGDYMQERDIEPASEQGQALRQTLLASKLKAEAAAVAQLDPRYKNVGPFILAAAKEYAVAPSYVEAAVKKRGLDKVLAGAKSQEQAERILDSVLSRDRFDRVLARYPKSRQGELMREVVSHLLVRSGKSIEEVSRDGVFVYADFYGRSLTNASAGRDPDPQTPNVLFYVRFEENKWRINVYRQNYGRGFKGGADEGYVEAFQQWLVSGGVPKEHLK